MEQTGSQNYIPVTMDELMNRFVLNLKRNEILENFSNSKEIFDKPNLRFDGEPAISHGVEQSMSALR